MANMFGVDLGTMNLKVYNRHNKTITKTKNTISLINKKQIYAFGDEAYEMYEKAPENIEVTFPIVNGVIADFNNMQNMILAYLETISKGRVKGSDFIVAVPTDITEVEKKAFFDLFYRSKAKPKNVLLCEKPIADAVGLGLNSTEPTGIMIVDIGSATTEISVVSLGGMVLSELLHYGGNRLDESISSYIRRNDNLVIGQKSAKLLKEKIGSALPEEEETTYRIVGLNVVSGLPMEMEISSKIIYESIKDTLDSICSAVKRILEKTPPELAKDVVKSGIYITGGSSQLKDFDKLIADVTGIQVNTCENPKECVVRGLSTIIAEPGYHKLAYTMKPKSFK
jgi:rod shape-determining protein MreB